MSLTTIAVIGILVMFVLFLLDMPISFAMLLVGFGGVFVVLGSDASMSLLTSDLYGQMSAYSLSVIPLFVLMGEVIYRSGIAKGLFTTAYKWFGGIRGGMAWTTILASAGFGSIAGSNAATTATIGTMALPELKRYNYNNRLSTGSIAAGGTLGVIIPPSTVILVLSLQTGLSVSTMFKAIMIPAGVLVALFLLMVSFVCWKNKDAGPASTEKFTFKEKMKSLLDITPVVVLFMFSVGGLLIGWFTPTEAGAFGALGAFAIAFVMKALPWEAFKLAMMGALKSSAMVIFLIIAATIFGRFLSVTRTPFAVAEWASNLNVSPVIVLWIILGIFIIGGALMDAIGFLVLAIPIFYPTVIGLGYDPVWFATVLCVVTSLGAITPPVGVNVFVTHGLDKSISPTEIFKGTWMFMLAYIILLVIMTIFPSIVTSMA